MVTHCVGNWNFRTRDFRSLCRSSDGTAYHFVTGTNGIGAAVHPFISLCVLTCEEMRKEAMQTMSVIRHFGRRAGNSAAGRQSTCSLMWLAEASR